MVSVVIPVLREEERLPACLDAVLGQVRDAGAEILVVDGGSDDGTREVVAGRPSVRWLDSPRGRGRQMNAGARAARGSLLVFLAADTLLPVGALKRLRTIDRAGTPVAGGFRESLDMEDVDFGERLRRRVRPRLLDFEVVTSSRRPDVSITPAIFARRRWPQACCSVVSSCVGFRSRASSSTRSARTGSSPHMEFNYRN